MTRPALPVLLTALVIGLAACGGSSTPDAPDLQASAAPVATDDEPTPSPEPSPEEPAATPTDEEPAASPAPTFDEVCAGRDDEAFIEVLTPRAGATVSDPVTVTGCGNTFEANFLYRVEAEDGTVLVEDFGTMSCGNGCVGEFSVDVEIGTTGPVLLTVFEASAKDGSPQHVVEVPLTVD